ncbi:protein mono-ADP-ribosyltransferase PARP14-like isoform X2 [Oncorhynchus clarkii lewisi]|uniref:protein mono-ADP-ribosyltransferase PARP14-like isoform X2 n=1 Tax=Oncorhynchus clarkii lewisi TaxID=490388 RepID=UPI0039B9B447
MAESYLFSVLVELEGNPDIPKLKNKLVKYFQSKKSSNGGDCLVEYEISKGQGAVVWFRTAEVRQMVLEKQEHKIKLDQGVLKLNLRLPSDEVTIAQEIPSAVNSSKQPAVVPKDLPESGDGETACPEDSGDGETACPEDSAATDKTELQSTSAVLGNIQESMNQAFLEMLVENIMNAQTSASPTASQRFSLEILPDISMAVVTFQNVKDTEYFISNCISHKIFKQKELSVKLLEITAKVKVENIPPNYSSDHLHLYYEKEGEVVDLEMCEEDQSAVITFQDPHAVHRVTKKHHDEKQPIKAFPFYESLGTALYDKDQPTLKLPAAFTENIDQAIWRYLCDKQEATATINKIMAENFCKVDLQHHTVLLRPLPSLLKQKDVKAKHVHQWKDTVKTTFTQALSKFKSLELNVQDCAWEESEQEICKAMSGEAVVVVPDKAKGALIVVGLVDEVDRLSQSLKEIMDKIAKIIEREKTSKTEELHLAPSIYHVISQDGLQGKIAGEYPELKMAYNRESQNVILTGLMQEVWGANRKIIDAVSALKRKKVEVSNYVLEFLQEEDQEKLSNSLFTSQSVNAALEIDRNGLELLAVSDLALSEAKRQLEKCLVSKYIDVEDSNVLEMSGWKDLTSRLEKTYNILSRTFMVKTSGVHPNIKVVVAGNMDIVNSVQKELGGFLFQNAPVDEILQIKSNAIVKFIQEKESAWSDIVKGGVKVSFKDEAICFSGIRVHVSDCLTLFKDLVSSTYFDTLQVPEPGAKKFFQDEEAMYVEAVKMKTACVVQLVDEMHLVSNDKTVQAMEEMVPKEFGNHGGNNLQQHLAISTETQHYRWEQSTNGSERAQTKEGLTITLMKGNIQDALTEVVVNTVGNDLILDSGAVSTALLNAAGPELQELINQHATAGKVGEVIITKGCNLKSKLVFHTIAPRWSNGQGATQKTLSEIVKKCLVLAEQQQLMSVTFPAIGTGNLGFPRVLVASLMLDKVLKFSSKMNPKHLKEVVFILHPSDVSTFKAFTDEFNKRFMTQSAISKGSASTQQGLFSKVTSSSGMHETKMGGVVIQVVTGDITKETTDVIVNSTNKTFNLKTGVSKAILDAAGPTVEAECQQLTQPIKDMILTEPGNLQSKKILHLVGISDPQNIQECVKDALKMCARKDFTSISFPALGTGQGNVQVSQVADAMFDALVEVVAKKSVNTLRLVRIVIFQTAMLTEFYNSMLKKENTDVQEEEDTDAQEAVTDLQDEGSLFKAFENIGTRIKSIFIRSKGNKPQKPERFVFMDKEVDPTCFHICGDSQAKVDEAKQWVKDLILKEQDSSIITDDAIINLTTSDRQCISNMINTMGVRVEQESSQDKLTIEGITKDVLKVTNEIQKMLQRIRSEEELSRSAELASTVVEWQYQQQGGQYQSFDLIHNFHLEQANETKKQHVEVTIQGRMYKVTLPNGPATDNHGNSLDIRRIDKAAHDSLPQYWDTMPDNSLCQSFPIQPGTSEHDEVLGLFQATCQNSVLKIERIQNPSLWRNLQIKKQEMDSKNCHQNNEKRLFHGTCPLIIDTINANGFNRSYAGKNAAVYGNGTYFAVEASYSADDTYSVPDSQGQKHMYLCHVLTGDFTEGQRDMIAPPAKSKSTTQLYDSVTDDPTAPSMFIVFNDIQAYPAYLITFI